MLGKFGNPVQAVNVDDHEYLRGYFSGATAGDGTMRFDPSWRSDKLGFPQMYWRIAVLEPDVAILHRVAAFLIALGVDAAIRPFTTVADNKALLKIACRAKSNLLPNSSALCPGDDM